jgi:hypothetical protein
MAFTAPCDRAEAVFLLVGFVFIGFIIGLTL